MCVYIYIYVCVRIERGREGEREKGVWEVEKREGNKMPIVCYQGNEQTLHFFPFHLPFVNNLMMTIYFE